VNFSLIYDVTLTYSEFSLKYTGDRQRQPAYEIKLMLSRVPWALAQISCLLRYMACQITGILSVY